MGLWRKRGRREMEYLKGLFEWRSGNLGALRGGGKRGVREELGLLSR